MPWVTNPHTGRPVKIGSRTYNSICRGQKYTIHDHIQPMGLPPNADINSHQFKEWIDKINKYYKQHTPRIEIVDLSKTD